MQTKACVLLFNPPILDFSAFDLWIRPLNLLRLATPLENAGLSVHLLDCLDRFHPAAPAASKHHRLEKFGCGHFYYEEVPKPPILEFVPRRFKRYGIPLDRVREELRRMPAPEVVILSCMMTYWYLGVVECSKLVREVFPSAFQVLVGVYPILCSEHANETVPVDWVCSDIHNDGLLEQIGQRLGISISLPDGYIPPAFHLMSNRSALPLLTSSGCPLRCEYCASPVLSDGFRLFPIDAVLDDLARAVRDFGTTDFALYDDAFLIRKSSHAIPLLEHIAASDLEVRFHTPNALHAREIDLDTAQLLRRAGFVTIRLGLEFADSKNQVETGGKVSSDEFADAVDCLKRAGFSPSEMGAYVFIGYPGQTPQEAEEACEFVHRQGILIRQTQYAPTPGSRAWNHGFDGWRFDPCQDPLLHNCTLAPWRSEAFPPKAFASLRERINACNRSIMMGETLNGR